MQVRQGRSGRFGHHDRLEIAEARIFRGRGDALVGQYAGEQHGLRVERPQNSFQWRLVEGREAHLLHVPVVGLRAEPVEHLIAPRVLAQAAVLQKRALLDKRAGIVQGAETVTGPDDGHTARPGRRHETPCRLDRGLHVGDVDAALGVPAFGVQEIILWIDDDQGRAAGNELPGGFEEGVDRGHSGRLRRWQGVVA